ncbi:MAG: MFS transporter [Parabacteroides sp.]|nr:MFS transporter [Parabacteroides sp.]
MAIGIGFGVCVPAIQCLFVNVAPHHMRGTATSTYLTSFDFGVGIGMLAAGFIASHTSLATAYLVGSGCCLVSLLVYLRWVRPSYERYKLTD